MLSVLATTACFHSLNSPLNGACKNTHQREIKMKNEKNKIKLEQKQQATVKKRRMKKFQHQAEHITYIYKYTCDGEKFE